ncbi:MAG: ABC transporter substrate-binding protein [Candidatus Odinarchaeota archaeon]
MKNRSLIFSIAIIITITTSGIVTLSLSIFLNNTPQQEAYYTFIDSKNRKVDVPFHPNRIISMAPSITEILYALDIEDKLVGVTDYCDYPIEATTKPSIGGFSTPNLETIVSLNPDLIIAASWNAESVALLESLDLVVVVILSKTLDEIIENIGIIGNLTNSQNKALEVSQSLYYDMEIIINKTSIINQTDKIECYFEIWETPIVAGGYSFISDMITKAGAINIFGNIDLEWPNVQHEWIIASNPDVIFITEHSAPWYSQNVCDRTGYNVVNACINNRIYQCHDDIYLRTGPRIIMALENMTRYLYPSLFI